MFARGARRLRSDYQVRVIVIDGQPWFVLADLCRVLGVAPSASNVTQQIDPDGIREAYRIIATSAARSTREQLLRLIHGAGD
jgi:prophage antirepressor-like protein